MPKNSGLKHQPTVIILHHLEVGIEKSNQPGVHHTGAAVKIPPMIGLDSVMDTIQRSHHNIITDHYFCSESCPISLCPLANSAMWAACGLDSAKETNKIYQIIQKKWSCQCTKKIRHYNSRKYSPQEKYQTKDPNTIDVTTMHVIISTTFLK